MKNISIPIIYFFAPIQFSLRSKIERLTLRLSYPGFLGRTELITSFFYFYPFKKKFNIIMSINIITVPLFYVLNFLVHKKSYRVAFVRRSRRKVFN